MLFQFKESLEFSEKAVKTDPDNKKAK